jgi:replicative DNA helicase
LVPEQPVRSDLRESGCLASDSRIYLPDEGVYRPIKELEGKSGFRVLAVDDESYRLEPRRVTRALATGRKPVYRLTTRLGRTIRATGNHKFLAFDGWRRLKAMGRGMEIGAPRALLGPEEQTMSDEELALLGHLIGDGCTLPRHAIQYTSNERDLAELVAGLATDVFADAVRPRVVRERRWYQTYLSAAHHLTHGVRNPVARWLDELGVFGLRSYEKRVPEAVFAQPAAAIGVFLRHLWATDGTVIACSGRSDIRYDTASPTLARDVQSLLLRLGINARRKVVPMAKGRPSHRLNISGRDEVERFLVGVTVLGNQKEANAAEIMSRQWLRPPRASRDVIPRAAWQTHVLPAMAAAGIARSTTYPQTDKRVLGSSFYRSSLTRRQATQIAELVDSEELRNLATSDIYWDEIVSVEPGGPDDVYDLTVEGLHSFVADDLIPHSSLEQFADLAPAG